MTTVGELRIVAIAASAGGLQAVKHVLASLPASFPVPVMVLLHLEAGRESKLAEILDRATELQVGQAGDTENMEAGHVYVAPPGRHLTVADGTVRLTDDPPEHFVRPSADHLFRSIADAYDGHALVVVLSGSGSDGADGVAAVHAAGGTVFVQDADEAEHPGMPSSAISTGAVDRVLPLDEIAGALVEAATGTDPRPDARSGG